MLESGAIVRCGGGLSVVLSPLPAGYLCVRLGDARGLGNRVRGDVALHGGLAGLRHPVARCGEPVVLDGVAATGAVIDPAPLLQAARHAAESLRTESRGWARAGRA